MSSSLLLSLSSKPSLRKLALRSSQALRNRMFSSSSSTTTTNPYLMYKVLIYGTSMEDIDATTDIHYFDPVNEDEVIVQDKAFPMELRNKASRLVGMSHGWGVFTALYNKGKFVYLTDHYNPCASKTSPRIIPLHDLTQIYGYQAEVITNVAMTCAPSQSKDFAVAIKCLGRQLNFSRPNGNHKNSDLEMFTTHHHDFDQSMIMYSKRDQKFYMPSLDGNVLSSWDSSFEENKTGYELHGLRFTNLPELTQSEWEVLDSCSTTVQLVESPSSQRFLIKWYAQNHKPGKAMTFLCRGTKRFMVFREEEEEEEGEKTRIMSYTEDIGDLCIFLGRNEPFCVKASSFPGLNPNSIYFAGDGFGVYDISTRKPRSFGPKYPSAFSTTPLFPYWIPPMPV